MWEGNKRTTKVIARMCDEERLQGAEEYYCRWEKDNDREAEGRHGNREGAKSSGRAERGWKGQTDKENIGEMGTQQTSERQKSL